MTLVDSDAICAVVRPEIWSLSRAAKLAVDSPASARVLSTDSSAEVSVPMSSASRPASARLPSAVSWAVDSASNCSELSAVTCADVRAPRTRLLSPTILALSMTAS